MVGTSSSSLFVVLMVLQSLYLLISLLNVSQDATISCKEVSAVFQTAPFAVSKKIAFGWAKNSLHAFNESFYRAVQLYTSLSLHHRVT